MDKFIRKDAPLCACGCGERVKRDYWGKKWNKFVNYHNQRGQNNSFRDKKHSPESKNKMSIAGKGRVFTKEHKKNLSVAMKNNINLKNLSKEQILKRSISQMRCRTDGYCDAWSDLRYKNDCKKDHCGICEVKEEKRISKMGRKYSNLILHHKDLNPKNCHPDNLSTLCNSCHTKLHHFLKKYSSSVLRNRKQNLKPFQDGIENFVEKLELLK